MIYRVWDTDINRLHGTYDTEEEALALVRTLVSTYGDAYAEDLAVGCERPDGSFTEPLSGRELLARAEQVMAERERAEARPGEVVATKPRGGGWSGHDAPVPMAAKGIQFAMRHAKAGYSAATKAHRWTGRTDKKK